MAAPRPDPQDAIPVPAGIGADGTLSGQPSPREWIARMPDHQRATLWRLVDSLLAGDHQGGQAEAREKAAGEGEEEAGELVATEDG